MAIAMAHVLIGGINNYLQYSLIIVIRVFDVMALYENETIPSHLTVTVALDDRGIYLTSLVFHFLFIII